MELSGMVFDFGEDGRTQIQLTLKTELEGSPLHGSGRSLSPDPTILPELPPALLAYVEQAAAELSAPDLMVEKVLRQLAHRMRNESNRHGFRIKVGLGAEEIQTLTQELQGVRARVTEQLGVPLPMLEVVLDNWLAPWQYCIELQGNPLTRGRREDLCEDLAFCFQELAPLMLTQRMTAELVRGLQRSQPQLVSEVRKLPLPSVHSVLQNLLSDGVSIRELSTILESLVRNFKLSDDVETLSKYARLDLTWCRSMDEPSNS